MAENKNKLEELNDEQLDNVAGGRGDKDGGISLDVTSEEDPKNTIL